jgi:hypothetical protein
MLLLHHPDVQFCTDGPDLVSGAILGSRLREACEGGTPLIAGLLRRARANGPPSRDEGLHERVPGRWQHEQRQGVYWESGEARVQRLDWAAVPLRLEDVDDAQAAD